MGKTGKALSAIGLAFLSAAASPPLYHSFSGNLSPQPILDNLHTDAIVVFTGSHDRIVKGYDLYNAQHSMWLMVSGYDYRPSANVLNVDEPSYYDRVVIDLLARNTIENAQNVADWAINNNIKTIRLVTSDYHMARSYFELKRLLPNGIDLYADPVLDGRKSRKIDSEENRLFCRLYETVLPVKFCYEMREAVRAFGLM
jgi:uncharacterized SAM-binding protein YcdF (DUF218 family)